MVGGKKDRLLEVVALIIIIIIIIIMVRETQIKDMGILLFMCIWQGSIFILSG